MKPADSFAARVAHLRSGFREGDELADIVVAYINRFHKSGLGKDSDELNQVPYLIYQSAIALSNLADALESCDQAICPSIEPRDDAQKEAL